MRIGILTHYYKSMNYGGNLQAYAFVKELNRMGFVAEQLCYDMAKSDNDCLKETFYNRIRRKKIREIIVYLLKKMPISGYLVKRKLHEHSLKRERALLSFNRNNIFHSLEVYTDQNISEANEKYDAFISGSDQVWNLNWCYEPFFLTFAAQGKKKISYAASMAMDSITQEQAERLKNDLADFNAISVREKTAADLIQPLVSPQISVTLDPTLLLERDDWDQICADRIIDKPYVFCYFLGNNLHERKLAKAFAKKHGYQLVYVPMSDYDVLRKWGDQKIVASPEQFVSLIKYADYIFTDSFHAVVFSKIYEKQYFVFQRSTKHEMSSRITDITELFGTQERFCDDAGKENLSYIESLSAIDYSKPNEKFEKAKDESIQFLKDNLKN